MKKLVFGSFAAVLALSACGAGEDNASNGSGSGEETETSTLTVGASNVPHGEILEQAQPILAERGIELKIETYQDYILPNQDLESGDLDANYFQHIPYLEGQVADHGYDFANAGAIHIEPMGIYSTDVSSLDEIPENGTILMSNSVAEHGRMLSILEAEGLIKLDENVEKTRAEISDVVENEKNIQFETQYEPALLVQMYEAGEGDAVFINANYAIDAGLSPLNDSIALEASDSPYANLIVVQAGDENDENIQALVEVLTSQEIQDFILEEWDGAVIPVE